MKVNNQTPAPPQPVRERPRAQDAREKTVKIQQKTQEKASEPPQRDSHVGSHIDTRA